MKVEIETTVCGGFPVLVTANAYPAEPVVGYDRVYLEDIEIITRQGKPAEFMVAKMTPADWDQIEEELRGAI
jgi:hypothetical protein